MKSLLIAFILLIALAPRTAVSQDMRSLWPKKPVVLDGKPDEWPQPFDYYDVATKLQFAMSNDTGNIYLCIKVTDEIVQARLFRSGLNIWFDPKGKRKEAMGISFPLKADQPQNPEPGEKRMEQTDPAKARNGLARLKQHAMLEQTTLKVKGFPGIPEQVLPLQNNFGINASFSWDSLNILCIEYKIPLALVLGRSLTASDTAKQLGLGFVEPLPEAARKTTVPDGGNSNVDMSRGSSQMGNMNRGTMGYGASAPHSGAGYGHGEDLGWGGQEQKMWLKFVLGWQ